MSDSAQATTTASSNTPGPQELWVSSTGQQSIQHFEGPEAPGLNWDEYLGLQSNNAGVIWSRSNFNMIVLTLEQPITLPGTDLRANELQIEVHSEYSPEVEDHVNHFETKTEGVTIHFFENSPLHDTANSTITSTSAGSAGHRMRYTTREGCSIIGPLAYVMTHLRSPADGGDSFDLLLSIPSSSSDNRGSSETKSITVEATFDRGLEAITIGPNFEDQGTIRFSRLRRSDMRDPPGGEVCSVVQADGTVMSLGGISDGQFIFYSSSANPVDWNTMLVSHAEAMDTLRTIQAPESDDSDPDSGSDFDFGAAGFDWSA